MNKKFIFKYEPQASVKEIFTHFEDAVKMEPKNVSIATSQFTKRCDTFEKWQNYL